MLKKSKGFTLVELIIVIVIIGILAAVTVVGYTSQTGKARNNSAFVSLSEAIKGANVCVANGESVVTRADAAALPGAQICTTTDAVTGNWPVMTSFGGNWRYYNYLAADAKPTPGTPTFPTSTTNAITAPSTILISAANPATVGTPATTDPAVLCRLTGCTKYGTGY